MAADSAADVVNMANDSAALAASVTRMEEREPGGEAPPAPAPPPPPLPSIWRDGFLAPPSPPPPPPRLSCEKYTVPVECPSDIFDLLASFRAVFNQPA